MTARMLRPRVIIDYERTPFVMEAGDVRVTFDENVRACSGGEKLFDPRLPMLYLLEPGKLVLEVKFTEFLPDLVRRALPPRSSDRGLEVRAGLRKNGIPICGIHPLLI